MNLQLKKFNPATMSDDRVCVFIGKRNTGKSTLVKDIIEPSVSAGFMTKKAVYFWDGMGTKSLPH